MKLLIIASIIIGIFFANKNKKRVIEFLLAILSTIRNIANEYYSNKTLLIDSVNENYVTTNTPFNELYGLKLEGFDNVDHYFDKSGLDTIYRDFAKFNNSFIYYVIMKKSKFQKQYIFSHNKNLLLVIANFYGIKLMSGNEIANAIVELYLQTDYVVENKKLKPTSQIDFLDKDRKEPTYILFKNLIRSITYNALNELNLYQSYQFVKGVSKTKIQNLLQEKEFEGVVWNFFSFSDRQIKNHIDKIIASASWTGNKFDAKKVKDEYDAGKQYGLVNSIIYMKKSNDSVIGSISNYLKNAYVPNKLKRTKIVQKTPLKYRLSEFDFLVEDDYINNYITNIHKKMPDDPDIYGIDKNGSFVNYSFSAENDNPFSVIIASAGSGKSVAKQKMIAQMIDLNIETRKAERLGKGIKVRAYDVGYSDEMFINAIKTNPDNNVVQLESGMGSFKYNIVYVDFNGNKDDIEADIQFAADLISVIRQSQEQSVLTLPQMTCFKEIIRKIYQGKVDYQNYKIYDLLESHPFLYERLKGLGYEDGTNLKSIKEDEFKFLKCPLLRDVEKYAKLQSSNQQIAEIDRQTFLEISTICADIGKEPMFNTFDNVLVQDANFLSMELNNFKENTLFLPIFLCIFQKTYLKDRNYALWCKSNKIKPPKLFYAIEEARNFFRVPYFENILTKVVLEARKYNLHLCFIVQNADHIPYGVLKNINTRIFLLSPSKKEEVKAEVKTLNPPQKLIEAIDNSKQYEMIIWYRDGVFQMTLEITKEEMELFNTNPNLIVENKGNNNG